MILSTTDYSLVVKRNLEALGRLVDLIGVFTENHQLNPGINYLLNLAAEELFTNMVKYSPSGTGDIQMRLEIIGNEVVITFVDHGVPKFDIRTAPSEAGDQPLHERHIGGLGLHLIREMMDDVDYQYRDGNSIIVLKKSLENQDA
jgi:anti-sigma regulatory factor (Ser/Thr protein kinase)